MSLSRPSRGRPARNGRSAVRSPLLWLIIGAALLVLIAGGGLLFFLLGGSPKPTYVTQPVTRGSVVRVVIASGTVNPIITVQVGTYVSGVIQARYCDYNTLVKKGQLCAKIDPRPFQVIVDQDVAIVAVARAQLEKDKANLLYTKSALDRYEKLITTKAVSQDVYDLAKSQYVQAQAQIGYDYAAIERRQGDPRRRAGQSRLYEHHIAGRRHCRVAQRRNGPDRRRELSDADIVSHRNGPDRFGSRYQCRRRRHRPIAGRRQSERSRSNPTRTGRLHGVVTQVRQSPQTVQNVVTYNAVVSADNSAGLLMPGMTATVRFEAERRDNVLRVPNQALRYVPGGFAGQPGAPTSADNPVPSAGGSQIFVLRDGLVTRLAVVTGLDDDTYTEIVKGDLKAGDRVIVGEATPADPLPRTCAFSAFETREAQAT